MTVHEFQVRSSALTQAINYHERLISDGDRVPRVATTDQVLETAARFVDFLTASVEEERVEVKARARAEAEAMQREIFG